MYRAFNPFADLIRIWNFCRTAYAVLKFLTDFNVATAPKAATAEPISPRPSI